MTELPPPVKPGVYPETVAAMAASRGGRAGGGKSSKFTKKISLPHLPHSPRKEGGGFVHTQRPEERFSDGRASELDFHQSGILLQ